MGRNVGRLSPLVAAAMASAMKRLVMGPMATMASTGLLRRAAATLSGSSGTTVTLSAAISCWRRMTPSTSALKPPRPTTPMRLPARSSMAAMGLVLVAVARARRDFGVVAAGSARHRAGRRHHDGDEVVAQHRHRLALPGQADVGAHDGEIDAAGIELGGALHRPFGDDRAQADRRAVAGELLGEGLHQAHVLAVRMRYGDPQHARAGRQCRKPPRSVRRKEERRPVR